jgi:predicted nuclease of predicted toxin-antitoxin system
LVIWRYAAAHDFIIVTKDDDFSDLSVLHGAPPKVLLLSIGNCSSSEASTVLLSNLENITAFALDITSALHEIQAPGS